jgi:hypothetical protein
LEADSKRQRDRYAVREVYQRRAHRRQPYRNGYYEREFVTRVGTIRLRVARTREKSFLPGALEPFQRRAGDVAMLIREAFLRGISTRQVARVVATLTGEVVSPQTVSKLPPSVAETAHHQRDRALLSGSATNPSHGVLCQCAKRGPNHLLHLPEIQSGMEKPHPQPIYTRSLTSPRSGYT